MSNDKPKCSSKLYLLPVRFQKIIVMPLLIQGYYQRDFKYLTPIASRLLPSRLKKVSVTFLQGAIARRKKISERQYGAPVPFHGYESGFTPVGDGALTTPPYVIRLDSKAV
ncbi:16238_t:CDS:2 [Gigaspora rosea]|nr:16238_t:CDS:2 [Gigaspora rosea]